MSGPPVLLDGDAVTLNTPPVVVTEMTVGALGG